MWSQTFFFSPSPPLRSQTYARPDLYKCLQHHASGASNDEELRLVEITLSKFRQLGAGIESANDRKTFVDLDNKCASLSFQIEVCCLSLAGHQTARACTLKHTASGSLERSLSGICVGDCVRTG